MYIPAIWKPPARSAFSLSVTRLPRHAYAGARRLGIRARAPTTWLRPAGRGHDDGRRSAAISAEVGGRGIPRQALRSQRSVGRGGAASPFVVALPALLKMGRVSS